MAMSMKDIREAAENFGHVTNAEQLREAVPFIVNAQVRLAEMAKSLVVVSRALSVIHERASNYALNHPGALDNGLSTSPIGVKSGDITIDGNVYHFASGFGAVVRKDGEMLTQEFLSGLPKEWTKVRMSLDTTAIMSKYGKGASFGDALDEKGLVRSAKNEWKLKVDAATVDGIDE